MEPIDRRAVTRRVFVAGVASVAVAPIVACGDVGSAQRVDVVVTSRCTMRYLLDTGRGVHRPRYPGAAIDRARRFANRLSG